MQPLSDPAYTHKNDAKLLHKKYVFLHIACISLNQEGDMIIYLSNLRHTKRALATLIKTTKVGLERFW